MKKHLKKLWLMLTTTVIMSILMVGTAFASEGGTGLEPVKEIGRASCRERV